jgi:hypothetical protein
VEVVDPRGGLGCLRSSPAVRGPRSDRGASTRAAPAGFDNAWRRSRAAVNGPRCCWWTGGFPTSRGGGRGHSSFITGSPGRSGGASDLREPAGGDRAEALSRPDSGLLATVSPCPGAGPVHLVGSRNGAGTSVTPTPGNRGGPGPGECGRSQSRHRRRVATLLAEGRRPRSGCVAGVPGIALTTPDGSAATCCRRLR